ncbi:hypothetical protein FRC10_010440 [Ceratobasidium sp. 414]|nr:hypothetical protein FRC10_010440 [Ceratobasidium sp. 414]
MVGRAALNIYKTNQSYFFKGDKYVKIYWIPGSTQYEGVCHGPTEFASEWDSLRQAEFSQIDAILPIPGHQCRAYFFSGSKYARIEYCPGRADRILGGVRSISGSWPSITKAGFDHVDGALVLPGSSNEAYIFSGTKYCRIRFTEGETNDELIDGPYAISDGWKAATFKQIDTVIPRPGSSPGAYMFSGDKYAQIRVVVGGTDELVGGVRDVAPYWPSLEQAGFY